jgi:hypothetical protein
MREHLAHNVRNMFTRTAVLGVLAVAAVACADDGPRRAEPAVTTVPVATELAPSQVTASTVATPAAVPPCAVADLELAAGEDAVILIRNTGAIECEVDVSQSPNRDPLMEPSVWLQPGGEGQLAVAPDDAGCEQRAAITGVDIVVNGEPVTAPIVMPATCGVTLTAIYTAD